MDIYLFQAKTLPQKLTKRKIKNNWKKKNEKIVIQTTEKVINN